MLNKFDVVLIALMVAAATLTYRVKHEAEEELEAVRALQAEIRLQEDTIDLLRADWSLLNQPARLQRLIGVYADELQLQTTEPEQVATLRDVPERPAETPEADGNPRVDPIDGTVTGSVGR